MWPLPGRTLFTARNALLQNADGRILSPRNWTRVLRKYSRKAMAQQGHKVCTNPDCACKAVDDLSLRSQVCDLITKMVAETGLIYLGPCEEGKLPKNSAHWPGNVSIFLAHLRFRNPDGGDTLMRLHLNLTALEPVPRPTPIERRIIEILQARCVAIGSYRVTGLNIDDPAYPRLMLLRQDGKEVSATIRQSIPWNRTFTTTTWIIGEELSTTDPILSYLISQSIEQVMSDPVVSARELLDTSSR